MEVLRMFQNRGLRRISGSKEELTESRRKLPMRFINMFTLRPIPLM
jgi:hypothetical protein